MQLKHLIGSERLKTALAPFYKENFPQSVILEGAYGTGKKTAAFDIACALFCELGNKNLPEVPCEKCGPCRRMAAGSHPDYTVFNLQNEIIKVDDVREIRRLSFIRPSESEQKIFVINAANQMNVQAQNALLKVLEEPQGTIFILLCENAHTLLQTVRSRCMKFSSCELSDEEITTEIAKRKPSADLEKIKTATAASRGSLGRALEIIDGEEPKAMNLAEEFMAGLKNSELKTFECGIKLGAFSRDEALDFCNNLCLLLCDFAKNNQNNHASLVLYDFICESARRLISNNASVSMTAAAICAKAAQIMQK